MCLLIHNPTTIVRKNKCEQSHNLLCILGNEHKCWLSIAIISADPILIIVRNTENKRVISD